jgi:hypothetical protein
VKVLDLQCSQQHVFEGWFGSEDDYQSQIAHGLVTCPMCGDASVTKKLSAPRLNLNTAASAPHAQANSAPTPADPTLSGLQEVTNLEPAQLQAALLKIARHVVANTEDVGSSFPEEARKMHYGEAAPRNIRGHATARETEALMDEGIAVMPMPLPDVLKGPLQ